MSLRQLALAPTQPASMSSSTSSLSNSSAPGGYYQGSHLPAGRPWYEYNYCNGPHVSAARYERPKQENIELVYVTSLQRHAKVRITFPYRASGNWLKFRL
jgi:hypothetical protein